MGILRHTYRIEQYIDMTDEWIVFEVYDESYSFEQVEKEYLRLRENVPMTKFRMITIEEYVNYSGKGHMWE